MSRKEPDYEARSPWSALHDVEEARLDPPRRPPEAVSVTAPGSKSMSNRVLIMAAMAEGRSIVRNILRSDDTYWCIDALRKLGVQMEVTDEEVRIEGTSGVWPNRKAVLYAGAAGTIARFLPGALAAGVGEWRLAGSASLTVRPIEPLVRAINVLGGNIRYEERAGRLPIIVEAAGLGGGRVEISGAVSSQFVSGVMLASPYAAGRTEIIVPGGIVQHAYVGITVDLMRRFGAEVTHGERFERIEVQPKRYSGQTVSIEADASTACYYMAYAALTGGSVRIANLNPDTLQPDIGFTDLLQRMGCAVRKGSDGIEVRGPGRLRGGFAVSMREMSDQTMTLAAMAPFADAPIAITDVAHIRHHESDRISVMCESLRRLGIAVEEREDGLTVHPGVPDGGAAVLDTYDDHRVAMSLALIGARVPGIRLSDPGCVSKTSPAFFDEMKRLGLQVRFKRRGEAENG
ncbi:3-phosphoshikimate 1-carboxyvinyltransferase [Paenibacillus mesophilus]|uniref:3-phosphoshikimate 1-carboxyvinyltransferase n=1 Tax=Paenibacillus mesophilus TaxID=2582849 RepID=UPI00192E6522|nr:3-phosphoshikimate 1-carboxyvinyltransferase [Paenibacillus mesophilus]